MEGSWLRDSGRPQIQGEEQRERAMVMGAGNRQGWKGRAKSILPDGQRASDNGGNMSALGDLGWELKIGIESAGSEEVTGVCWS